MGIGAHSTDELMPFSPIWCFIKGMGSDLGSRVAGFGEKTTTVQDEDEKIDVLKA